MPAYHKAKKRFGQNFLVDEHIISRIISTISAKPDDNMIEIGIGMGALTLPLLQKLKQLHVIEIDKLLIKYWQDEQHDNLLLHNADVLNFDFDAIPKPWRVVGNLPYNISSPILIAMLKNRAHITDMCFMLQKEVAERISANHGSKVYGRLSVMLQTYFDINYLFDVPNTAFNPMPKVKSGIVLLTPKKHNHKANNQLPYESLSFIVKLAFATRRKTLSNCLKLHLTQEQTRIDLKRRAESLSVDEFTCLTYDYLETTTPLSP